MKSTLLARFASLFLLTFAVVGFAGASCEKPKRTDVDVDMDVEAKADADVKADAGKKEATKSPQAVGPDAPALFIVSGLKGYTEPCGCTLDIMLGGIDRIVRYVKDARGLYPGFAMVDAGDLLFDRTEILDHELSQEKARIGLIVEALKELPIAATVPGERDFALGVDFYQNALSQTSIKVLGANYVLKGKPLPGSMPIKAGNTSVFIVAAGDPSLFEDVEGIKLSDPDVALKTELAKAPKDAVVVLLGQGKLGWVKKRLETHPAIDFGVVGRDPRETDQTDAVGQAFTLEAYDQGRYMGILKMNRVVDGKLKNARMASAADMEKIDRQIEHVNESINRLPPASAGSEPPMLLSLRERLAKLRTQKEEFKHAKLDTPDDRNWFLWTSVPMEPEYPTDPAIETARLEYNKSLKKLAMSVDRAVVPVEDGQPEYIGSDQCGTCHLPAFEFWKKTPHGTAYDTLVSRDKDFDLTCVGCHVVGYEKPGGSVVGKVQYPASLGSDGGPKLEWTKDLRHVGCENCHGPGSQHRLAPVGNDGKPQHIKLEGPVDTCMQCHVPEHSPRFNYDTYIKMITGEGHELRPK